MLHPSDLNQSSHNSVVLFSDDISHGFVWDCFSFPNASSLINSGFVDFMEDKGSDLYDSGGNADGRDIDFCMMC